MPSHLAPLHRRPCPVTADTTLRLSQLTGHVECVAQARPARPGFRTGESRLEPTVGHMGCASSVASGGHFHHVLEKQSGQLCSARGKTEERGVLTCGPPGAGRGRAARAGPGDFIDLGSRTPPGLETASDFRPYRTPRVLSVSPPPCACVIRVERAYRVGRVRAAGLPARRRPWEGVRTQPSTPGHGSPCLWSHCVLGKTEGHSVPCAECEEVTGSGTGGRAGAGPGAAWQVRGASTCLALRVSSALSYKTPRPLSVC